MTRPSVSENTIYRFSPDFRPKRIFASIYACCGKEIKDIKKAIPVTLDWNNWTVIKGHDKHKESGLSFPRNSQ